MEIHLCIGCMWDSLGSVMYCPFCFGNGSEFFSSFFTNYLISCKISPCYQKQTPRPNVYDVRHSKARNECIPREKVKIFWMEHRYQWFYAWFDLLIFSLVSHGKPKLAPITTTTEFKCLRFMCKLITINRKLIWYDMIWQVVLVCA